ncbi:uncharacterized protein BDV14DRAFT_178196 [Aspergillus stella-maris]|uniref:uncharacterized protein n=1 Tax=Aspergillus stella-maris TaxID=1810926 RepID=UPI003CCD2EDD
MHLRHITDLNYHMEVPFPSCLFEVVKRPSPSCRLELWSHHPKLPISNEELMEPGGSYPITSLGLPASPNLEALTVAYGLKRGTDTIQRIPRCPEYFETLAKSPSLQHLRAHFLIADIESLPSKEDLIQLPSADHSASGSSLQSLDFWTENEAHFEYALTVLSNAFDL